MKKQIAKAIEQLANRLPVVYEQTVSGYHEEEGKVIPNTVNHQINHKRRIMKAYQQFGEQGIIRYLDMIRSIQDKRNARLRDAAGEGVHGASEDGSGLPDQDGVHDSVDPE